MVHHYEVGFRVCKDDSLPLCLHENRSSKVGPSGSEGICKSHGAIMKMDLWRSEEMQLMQVQFPILGLAQDCL